ncbi:hypothetical protein [Streptomyces phaeoluteigriseus]|uniref:hypothetical protein n=1 Tax=Streptomyces phaeoluteigriseus TaxID=114686 RepID=UPI003677589C
MAPLDDLDSPVGPTAPRALAVDPRVNTKEPGVTPVPFGALCALGIPRRPLAEAGPRT